MGFTLTVGWYGVKDVMMLGNYDKVFRYFNKGITGGTVGRREGGYCEGGQPWSFRLVLFEFSRGEWSMRRGQDGRTIQVSSRKVVGATSQIASGVGNSFGNVDAELFIGSKFRESNISVLR